MGLSVVTVFEGEIEPDAPRLARELDRLGVSTVALVAGGVGGLAGLRRSLRDVDVAHAHGMRAALAVSLARPGGTPLVVSLVEPPPVPGAIALVTRAVNRTVFAGAAAVLAPTPELAEVATRVGAREVRHVPPPLPDPPEITRTPEEVREELALPPDGPIVLAAAPLHTSTRLHVLVDAAARWRRREPRPEVVLAGVGPAYRALVAQATVARAPVTFAGDRTDGAPEVSPVVADPRLPAGPDAARTISGAPVAEGAGLEDRASLAELLAAATVAVVTDPRARPGFALAAARAGVALVVPQGGSVAGLFADGVVTVPPGDVEALDEAVQALLDDGRARADLVAAARARIAGWPDAAAVAGELAGVYAQVSRAEPAEVADTPG